MDGLPFLPVRAAITAARQTVAAPRRESVELLLVAAGWREYHGDPGAEHEDGGADGLGDAVEVDPDDDDLDDGGPLIRTWASPDATREVTWFGPDNKPSYWCVVRPDIYGQRVTANLSHHVPARVIAALALTD